MNPHTRSASGAVHSFGLPVGPVHLVGELVIPHAAAGVVIFAHGSGGTRHSPRNRFVASALHKAGLATVLLDLLTREEVDADDESAGPRFDVELLAHRLTCAMRWLEARDLLDGPVGLFGASTGAAAALVVAARCPDIVAAIVSRGGRADLAGEALSAVVAPTLLVVGGADTAILEVNRQAYNRLRCPRELAIVPGATPLFEEPGAR